MRRGKPPPVYVFDMDGTLADVSWRDPYDTRRCEEDPPNEPVLATARVLQAAGFGVVVTSGRQECARKATHYWLILHGLDDYLALFLRPDGDPRKDWQLKDAMYREHIRDHFDVVAVFDRPSVVAMWRSHGLACFQVAPTAEPPPPSTKAAARSDPPPAPVAPTLAAPSRPSRRSGRARRS